MESRILIFICAGIGFALTAHLSEGQARGENAQNRFHLTKVGYILLGVADIDRSTKFYQSKLGLKVVSKSSDLAFIDAGSISLALSTEVGKRPGDAEVVFSVEHVQAAFDGLRQSGIDFYSKPHQLNKSSWAASFKDPIATLFLFSVPDKDTAIITRATNK
ncbi:MAG: VOC family protein [Acidobacteriota bacterium]|nr:VOC family protein [Acidobacteriota bacterium]